MMNKDRRPGLRNGLLLLVLVAGVLGAAFYSRNPLTTGAQTYARSVAVGSGGVYLTLRSLNAFLSTAQEVEVGGSFVVQGSAQPFKVLEPVDDTIERVASMVFFVMISTGVLAVALGPTSAVGYAMLAGAAALAMVSRRVASRQAAVLARRLGWYGAFLGFALPCAFLIASLVADRMTEQVMAEHQAILLEISAEVAPEIDAPTETGAMDWLGGLRDDVEHYAALAATVYERADELIASLLAITAVFLFKLLILPALILGGLFLIIRFFAQSDPGRDMLPPV